MLKVVMLRAVKLRAVKLQRDHESDGAQRLATWPALGTGTHHPQAGACALSALP